MINCVNWGTERAAGPESVAQRAEAGPFAKGSGPPRLCAILLVYDLC